MAMAYAPGLPLPRVRRVQRRGRPNARPLLYIAAIIVAATGLEVVVWDSLRYTPEQRAEMQAVDAMLKHITVFRVACPGPQMDQAGWHSFITASGWADYPAAGPGCVIPDRKLNYVNVDNFSVACPTMAFNVADQQRWAAYAAHQNWPPYPQAGTDCVDP